MKSVNASSKVGETRNFNYSSNEPVPFKKWNMTIMASYLIKGAIYEKMNFCDLLLIVVQMISGAFVQFHMAGMRLFGRCWLPQYLGPLYPGVIAHKYGTQWFSLIMGHGPSTFTKPLGVFESASVSQAVQDRSIRECATKNGGICSFWAMGMPMIYINDYNVSLQMMKDPYLKIPLLGELSGIEPEEAMSKITTTNRIQALKSIMTPALLFERLMKFQWTQIRDLTDQIISIKEFSESTMERVVSTVLFDLKDVPLDHYMKNPKYKNLLYGYLDHIVNFTQGRKHQAELAKLHDEFMITLIKDNWSTISSDKNHIFQSMYRMYVPSGFPKKREDIGMHSDERKALKPSLGLIAGSLVNTANQLNWVIRFIEKDPDLKKKVVAEARRTCSTGCPLENFSSILKAFPIIHKVILETLRYSPLVSTLGKVVKVPHEVEHKGNKVQLNEGTLLLIDLYECNRSKELFPFPNEFNIDNIDSDLLDKGLMAFLNNLHSIRSFGGGHFPKNSSRCPGRFFMVSIGVLMIADLYGKHEVESNNVSLRFENDHTLQLHTHVEDQGTITLKSIARSF